MYFLSNIPQNIVPKIITDVITEISITIIFLLFVFIDIYPLNFAMTAVLYCSKVGTATAVSARSVYFLPKSVHRTLSTGLLQLFIDS